MGLTTQCSQEDHLVSWRAVLKFALTEVQP